MFFSALFKTETFQQFSRYLIVGGAGFLIDAIGMETLHRGGMHILAARACSMALAMMVTYFLHRGVTFRGSHAANVPASSRQFSLYMLCQLTAAAFNYGLFALVLFYLMPQPPGMSARFFSLCLGTGLGLFFNFTLLRYVAFAGGEKKFKEDVKKLFAFIKLHKRLWVWGLLALGLFVTSLARHMLVLDLPNISEPLPPSETDVWTRLSSVRQWMQGGDFFSHVIANTNAPSGGVVTPWTRPMDFLLWIFSFIVPHAEASTLDHRLLLAAAWLPSFLLAGAIALLSAAGMRRFDHIHVFLLAALLLTFNPISNNYFAPGNVDHHGLLILLWCGALCGLMKPLTLLTAATTGLFLGLMIWVSPESFVPMAYIYGVLGFYILFWRPQEMSLLALMATVVTVTASLALFVEIPAREILTDLRYDSLSIVHVTILLLVAAGATVAALFFRRGISLPWRIVTLGAVFVMASASLALLFPRALAGPLADADSFVFKHFLPNVNEVQPLLKTGAQGVVVRLYVTVVGLFLLGLMFFHRGCSERRRRFILIFSLLLPIATLIVFYQVRWNYYLQPIAALSIAVLLPSLAIAARGPVFGWLRHFPRHARPHVWIWAVFFILAVAVNFIPESWKKTNAVSNCASQMYYAIQSGQLEEKLGSKDLTLMIHSNYGGEILFFTPYKIIAGNYHREGKGLTDLRLAFIGEKPEETRRILLKRKVDAIYLCPSEVKKESWLSKLRPGRAHPAWMKEVGGIEYMPEKKDSLAEKKKDPSKKNKIESYDMPLLYKVRR